jgi:hypothetical protein
MNRSGQRDFELKSVKKDVRIEIEQARDTSEADMIVGEKTPESCI